MWDTRLAVEYVPSGPDDGTADQDASEGKIVVVLLSASKHLSADMHDRQRVRNICALSLCMTDCSRATVGKQSHVNIPAGVANTGRKTRQRDVWGQNYGASTY